VSGKVINKQNRQSHCISLGQPIWQNKAWDILISHTSVMTTCH